MSVAVLIAWRPGCPYRERALEYVTARAAAEHPDWQVVVGEHDEGLWNKALAVDAALSQTDAAVLVVADADVVCDGLAEAVQRVQDSAAWCIPHRGVLRLTERATAALLATGACDLTDLAERAYLGVEGGGAAVLRREAYEATPLDSRFRGWSGEDESWGWALRTLHGPATRVKQPLVHLWHPSQERATRARGSQENWALRKRYAQAFNHPSRMAALIEEAQACRSAPCSIAP